MPVPIDGSLFWPFRARCKRFIETGSYRGDGVQAALNAGFLFIYTIELSPHYYDMVFKRFGEHARVTCIEGDSVVWLWRILKAFNSEILFWLDAHCSLGNTAGEHIPSTVLRELDEIAKAKVTQSVILIDDVANGDVLQTIQARIKELWGEPRQSILDGFQSETGNTFPKSILSVELP